MLIEKRLYFDELSFSIISLSLVQIQSLEGFKYSLKLSNSCSDCCCFEGVGGVLRALGGGDIEGFGCGIKTLCDTQYKVTQTLGKEKSFLNKCIIIIYHFY